jgi:hypothetical protein
VIVEWIPVSREKLKATVTSLRGKTGDLLERVERLRRERKDRF